MGAFGSSQNRKDITIYAAKAPANRPGRVRRLHDIKLNGVHRHELELVIQRCTMRPASAWVLGVVELKARNTSPDEMQAPHCITRSLVPAPAMERP